MTERELKILEFMTEVRVASTQQLAEMFFKNLHHSVQYNVLGRLVENKLIRRKRMQIDTKRQTF